MMTRADSKVIDRAIAKRTRKGNLRLELWGKERGVYQERKLITPKHPLPSPGRPARFFPAPTRIKKGK
jgi:hypothetical protein